MIDRTTDSDPACCDKSPKERHAACWPIEIPENDPFYSLFRRRCMEFVRSASSLKPECKLGISIVNCPNKRRSIFDPQ